LAKKILVVDDDRDSAEMIVEFLAMHGYQASFALNGQSAVESARQIVPDVALLDITLPDMSGYELAQLLRAEPTLQRLVLIALTGWSGSEREAKAREAGFDHHMVKPLDFSKLQALLEPAAVAPSSAE
jgi:CheY-like chemotaxis protein